MARTAGLDRRAFLKSAGATAFAGALGAAASPVAGSAAARSSPSDSKYDFDTVYSRVGTECIKWDQQIALYGKENIAVGMGIADMDFKAAPCITRALQERMKHEN